MLKLLLLATAAAAQFWGPQPVQLQLGTQQDDFEFLLDAPFGGPLQSLSPQGLVIIRQETQTFEAPEGLLGQLLAQVLGRPSTYSFVATEYDDDAEETHDFGCPCGQDVARLCPDSAGDDLASVFETRLCLARARDYLSDACFEHLSEAPTVVEYCADDIAARCPGVAPGGNRVHSCLAAQPSLSGQCGAYVASVGTSPRAPAPAAAYQGDAPALVASAFKLLDAFAGRAAAADDEALGAGPFDAPMEALLQEQTPPPRAFLRQQPAPATAFARKAAPAPEQMEQMEVDAEWVELEEAMAERAEEAEEAAAEEELAEEEQDERAQALANLLLALCFLAIGMSTFVLSYVVAYGLRKRREQAAVQEFKAKFAPLLNEQP